MSQKKEGVCFTCTAEQEADLKRVISELKDTAGALMPFFSTHRRFWLSSHESRLIR